LRIADFLGPEAVIADLGGRTADAVLAELCRPLGSGADLGCALNALLERERLGSTAIGDGLAVPHARIAGLPRLTGIFGRSRLGVDFGASDGRRCHFFFALFVPADDVGVRIVGVQVGGMQIKALARIGTIFGEQAFREGLLDARDAAHMYRLISAHDDEDAR
jgi:PTS system nitrogen regulatory IIA component